LVDGNSFTETKNKMIKANNITDITEITKNNNHKIIKNNNISTSTLTLASVST